MPEHEAQVRAFYDHETEEPRATGRRRRQVADWGVGEDVFDRLPSRRFTRAERRGEAAHEPRPRRDDELERRFARDEEPRARREVADWARAHDDPPRPRRDVADWGEAEVSRPRRDEDLAPRRERRPAADWLAEVSPSPTPVEEPDPDEQRTIVVGGAVEEELAPAAGAPKPRRTVVIGGHPDKLPPPRPRRPPRTAAERLGASPDRIMGYAVALGLLLILIAVLTTSH